MAGGAADGARGRRKPTRRATWARWAYWIHGLAGLKLGLVLSFIMVTGTLAVFGHEIDWLFGPYQRVVPDGEAAGLAEVYAAARAARPDHAILRVEAPRGPRSVATVLSVSPARQYRHLYVDPYRPEAVAETSPLTAQNLLRQIHQSLLLPKYGRLFVSGLSILTLLSLISGLICYKRFWRGFLKVPRRRDLRTFLGDTHRLAAVWSLWFIAVMAVTGLWYFYESLDTFGEHYAQPSLSDAVLARAGAVPPDPPVAAAITAARAALPGLKVRHLVLPDSARDPLVIEGYTGAWLVRPRAAQVRVDPTTGQVLAARPAQALGVKARLHEAADPLHFGDFAGIWSKLVWFVFGAALSFLSISGLVIHAKRLARAPPRRSAPAVAGKGAWAAGDT